MIKRGQSGFSGIIFILFFLAIAGFILFLGINSDKPTDIKTKAASEISKVTISGTIIELSNCSSNCYRLTDTPDGVTYTLQVDSKVNNKLNLNSYVGSSRNLFGTVLGEGESKILIVTSVN